MVTLAGAISIALNVMKHTTVKRIFVAALVLLPTQYGAALLCEYRYGIELWPAVVFPSFGRIYGTSGAIEVEQPVVYVSFEDSVAYPVSVHDLLYDAPASHRRTIMRRNFSSRRTYPSNSVWAPPAETTHWLGSRLTELFYRRPRHVEIRWCRFYYSPEGREEIDDDSCFESVRIAL